jgi:hypothetical protein
LANSTLLALFQNALQGMGVAGYGQPATVVANTSQDVVQTLALCNAAGDEINREWNWQAAAVQYNFTEPFYSYSGTATAGSTTLTGMSSIANLDSTYMVVGTGVDQDTFVVSAIGTTVTINRAATGTATGVLTFSKVLNAFPADYDRPVDRTQWDKSKHWEMLGPSTAQQWNWLKSGWISTGPRIRFRPLGGYFAIWPALGSTESLSFEYQSKNWIYATGSTTLSKQAFTADTDTCMFPDSVMRLMIKLKYYEAKNFDTSAVYRDYLAQLDIAKAADAGSATLSMNPKPAGVLIGWENIPDSNYGT